jgi:hypothetical protein
MTLSAQLTPEQQKRVDEITRKFKRNLQLRPEVSDEEFMAETEVSDEEYAMGLTLPGPGGSD